MSWDVRVSEHVVYQAECDVGFSPVSSERCTWAGPVRNSHDEAMDDRLRHVEWHAAGWLDNYETVPAAERHRYLVVDAEDKEADARVAYREAKQAVASARIAAAEFKAGDVVDAYVTMPGIGTGRREWGRCIVERVEGTYSDLTYYVCPVRKNGEWSKRSQRAAALRAVTS